MFPLHSNEVWFIVLMFVPLTNVACFVASWSCITWLDGYFVVLSVNVAVSLFEISSGVYPIVSCFCNSKVFVKELEG